MPCNAVRDGDLTETRLMEVSQSPNFEAEPDLEHAFATSRYVEANMPPKEMPIFTRIRPAGGWYR